MRPATDPEHLLIDEGYVDPMDRDAYERARDDWRAEMGDRQRDAEEDAR